MPSHFSCIGLDLPDKDALGRLISELAPSSARSAGELGTRLFWHDPSGAAVAIFLGPNGKDVVCLKPTFVGQSSAVVRPTAMLDDPNGCPFCAVAMVEVLEDDEMIYPLAIELDDLQSGALGNSSGLVELAVVAFGESIETWPDEQAYLAGGSPFATQSLIPSGTFSPGGERPVRAEAMITGVVVGAERRTNGHSGRPFDYLRLETLGATIDAVMAPLPEPLRSGCVVQGTFWIVAHRTDSGQGSGPVKRWLRGRRG